MRSPVTCFGYVQCKTGMRDVVYDELKQIQGILELEPLDTTDKRPNRFDFVITTMPENYEESKSIDDALTAIKGIDFCIRPGYGVAYSKP